MDRIAAVGVDDREGFARFQQRHQRPIRRHFAREQAIHFLVVHRQPLGGDANGEIHVRHLAQVRRPLAAGSKVTLGIRPEHLALAPGGLGLPLSIELVERLGGESYLYGTAAGLPQITLRLDGQSEHERGHEVALAFPQQSLHLFDEAGRAIRP